MATTTTTFAVVYRDTAHKGEIVSRHRSVDACLRAFRRHQRSADRRYPRRIETHFPAIVPAGARRVDLSDCEPI